MSAHGTSRPRISNACRECRRRKVKCDLARPSCTRCRATPDAHCFYDADDPATVRDYQFVPPKVAEDLSRRSPGRPPSSSQGPGQLAVSSDRLQSLEERLENLTGLVHALQSSRSTEIASSEVSGELGQSVKRSRTAPPPDSPASSEAGHLDVQAGGRTRYISRSHWAAMCEEAAEIDVLLRGQTRYNTNTTTDSDTEQYPGVGRYTRTLISAPPAWDPSCRSSSKFRQVWPLQTLQIPDRSRCDVLFEAFVSNYHPIVPLTHIPSFRREYQRFWDSRSSDRGQQAVSTPPLILAALYAGAAVCPRSTLEKSLHTSDCERFATDLYEEATTALRLAHFPRVPTLGALSAYLIIQGTWMRDEEPLNTCSFVGVAVRVSQMLGLHKDPSHFSATISPIAAETCRRVFWHVFHLDVLVAGASGLPPLIDRDSWNTRMVSELYEDLIGTVAGLQYDEDVRKGSREPDSPQRAVSFASPMGIWLQGKLEETVAFRDLLNKAFSHNSITISDMKSIRNDLESLKQRMLKRVERIPIDSEANTYENNKQFNLWAKTVLSALGEKNWWFLHSPLLNRTISQAWQDLIPTVQRHCCSFMQNYIVLACGDDFYRFQWSWPGNHQPLHALMMLLKEVERNPSGPGAEASRTVIDHAIALCSPEGGITGHECGRIVPRPLTEGGSEAWEFINRLRARAWTKAGLDPDIIVTRDEVCNLVRDKLGSIKSRSGLDFLTPLSASERPLDLLGSPQPENSRPLAREDTIDPSISWDEWDALFGTVEP